MRTLDGPSLAGAREGRGDEGALGLGAAVVAAASGGSFASSPPHAGTATAIVRATARPRRPGLLEALRPASLLIRKDATSEYPAVSPALDTFPP